MNITILGCGRWGSFHAWYQSRLNNSVLVWGRHNNDTYVNLASTRKNEYLTLPESVIFTDQLSVALAHSEYIFIAINAQGMQELAENIGRIDPKQKTFVICIKGIDNETGQRMSEILKSKIDKSNKICVWVGPGHVQDFLKGQPNVMLIDGENPDAISDVADKFKSDLIKFYEGDDLIGTEVGAAAKNVLGIIAGILDGAKVSSLKGALMARGIYEVSKLIVAMGGKQMTAYGLSHLGDFEATIFSKNSHNRAYGEKFYKLINDEHSTCPHEQCEKCIKLAEGVATSKAIMILSKRFDVDMPICGMAYKILHENKDPKEAFHELFVRGYSKEFRY